MSDNSNPLIKVNQSDLNFIRDLLYLILVILVIEETHMTPYTVVKIQKTQAKTQAKT